jgi:hypothetical protein
MTNQQTNVSNVDIDLDEFLPLPGADDVITTGTEPKKNIFSQNPGVDMSFLENDDKKDDEDDEDKDDKDDKPDADKSADTSFLDDLDGDEDDKLDEPGKKTGRPRVDKNGLIETVGKLIEKGTLLPFDDGKKLEEYSAKDWEELIEANLQERERAIREQTPKEFFESLPDELQYAAKYVADGGSDLKGLFRALASVEESRSLDPATDSDVIARQYLQATQFGTAEEIAEQIQEWQDLGVLEKKAGGFKPKLDRMHEEMVQAQLAQQENMKKQREQAMKQYQDNVYETLKTGELNGVKLDKKTQAFLFTEMTQAKYQSMSGRQVNLLGHLLEKYQYTEPRYDLIAEAMWLLSNPDEYKENIKTQAKNAAAAETVRQLKTEQGRRIASNVADDKDDEKDQRRTISRKQRNIFS